MNENINKLIENEIKNISLPKYNVVKFMDDTDEFIIYKYSVSEYTWSNDKADSYVADVSLLISVKTTKKLAEVIQQIIDETDFQLIATGQHENTLSFEAIFYSPFLLDEEEIYCEN